MSDEAELEILSEAKDQIAGTPGAASGHEATTYTDKAQQEEPADDAPINIDVDYKVDMYPYGMLLTGGTGTSHARSVSYTHKQRLKRTRFSDHLSLCSGHPRITILKNLATFLRNNRDSNPPSIKIAILDDGLDSSLDLLKTGYTRIEAGLAFYSSDRNNMSDYYVPSGDHGSRVASLICSICPVTTLYIAKLEHEVTRSGTTQINTTAAAKVRRSTSLLLIPSNTLLHRLSSGPSSAELTSST